MAQHNYTVHDYYGVNFIGNKCHVMELRDNGEKVFSVSLDLGNGSKDNVEALQKRFYEKADRYLDSVSIEQIKKMV